MGPAPPARAAPEAAAPGARQASGRLACTSGRGGGEPPLPPRRRRLGGAGSAPAVLLPPRRHAPRRGERHAPRAMYSGLEAAGAYGVRVYETDRQEVKRVVAETAVAAPPDVVWRVLTDYEALPRFVPNLESCVLLPSPRPGRVRVRQRGVSQGALWRLEAEAVLEVEEAGRLPGGRREVRFEAVEGDFREFSGRWVVDPDPGSPAPGGAPQASLLRYEIACAPRLSLPSAVVSYVVRAGLPANIKAVARRSEELAARRLGVAGLASWAGVEEDPPLPPAWEAAGAPPGAPDAGGATPDAGGAAPEEDLPSKGPFWPLGSPFAAAAPLTARAQRARAALRSSYLGVISVPLPAAAAPPPPSRAAALNEALAEKERLAASYPEFGLRQPGGWAAGAGGGGGSSPDSADDAAGAAAPAAPVEVHLRRLDEVGRLHRRAVAAVTVDAPPAAVWAALTDYDALAQYVPNLAASERIALPPGAPPGVVRVRQVGYKRVGYMCLHAECVMDLVEKGESEIQFRQVAGDFERFQGKWMLQELPPARAAGGAAPRTLVKYAVEVVVPSSSRLLGVMEPLLERLVFEDVPANLAAVKRRVEAAQVDRVAAALEGAGQPRRAAAVRRRASRPRLGDMADDFGVLAAELERLFGAARALPPRARLRELGRTDLEKAIRAHGGAEAVAERLGWGAPRARKPRGYWDALPNVRAEVDEFAASAGLAPRRVPLKNDFVRAGRFDLARAVERWGGLYALAAELGYGVAEPSYSGTEWQEHVAEVAATTGLSGRDGLFELAARTYRRGSADGADDDGAAYGSLDDGSESEGEGEGEGKGFGGGTDDAAAAVPAGICAYELPSVRDEIDRW